jgi:hypothetical protein
MYKQFVNEEERDFSLPQGKKERQEKNDGWNDLKFIGFCI